MSARCPLQRPTIRCGLARRDGHRGNERFVVWRDYLDHMPTGSHVQVVVVAAEVVNEPNEQPIHIHQRPSRLDI